jgi:hypothetical protein
LATPTIGAPGRARLISRTFGSMSSAYFQPLNRSSSGASIPASWNGARRPESTIDVSGTPEPAAWAESSFFRLSPQGTSSACTTTVGCFSWKRAIESVCSLVWSWLSVAYQYCSVTCLAAPAGLAAAGAGFSGAVVGAVAEAGGSATFSAGLAAVG